MTQGRLSSTLRLLRVGCLVVVTAISCSDTGSALIALDLEITVENEAGDTVPNVRIWLEDNYFAWKLFSRKGRHLVCTTDEFGQCSGEIRYRYAVRRYQWQKVQSGPTAPTRFEIKVERDGQLTTLGYLPPLASKQLHGLETVSFTGVVHSGRI